MTSSFDISGSGLGHLQPASGGGESLVVTLDLDVVQYLIFDNEDI